MNCREVRKYIPLHAGDDLPENVPGLLEHLASCPRCRRDLEAYRALRRALGAVRRSGSPVSGDAFLEGVRRRVASATPAASPAQALFPTLLLRGAATAAAVALLLAGILYSTAPPAHERPGAEPAEAGAGRAGGLSPDPASEPLLVAPSGAPVRFGLSQTEPASEDRDVLLERTVVPDPKENGRPGEREYTLSEMRPVLEAEISTDL